MKKSFLYTAICISFFCIFNSSCKRCKKTNYPDKIIDNYPTQEDLSWIVFNNNDTLIYKNNFGNFDTVTVIVDPDYSNGGSYYPPGEYSSCEDYPMIWKKLMGFYLTTFDTTIRFIVFKTPNSVNNLPPIIAAYNLSISSDYYLSNYLPTTLIQNGQTYENVYEIAGDSLSTTQSHIWRFYYQKEKWLLRVDQLGGIRWERVY